MSYYPTRGHPELLAQSLSLSLSLLVPILLSALLTIVTFSLKALSLCFSLMPDEELSTVRKFACVVFSTLNTLEYAKRRKSMHNKRSDSGVL